ncbi:ORF6 protein [Bat SARS-like coronavirus Khosta-2]|nr:ORF6 protein [Bat SARS-like coronavirus Khosta-2]
MFSLVDFQVTIAELLILIMDVIGVSLVRLQKGTVMLMRFVTKHLDGKESNPDEEVPMEVDHP